MALDEDRETPVDGGGLLWDAVVGEQGALPPTTARAKLLHIVPAGRGGGEGRSLHKVVRFHQLSLDRSYSLLLLLLFHRHLFTESCKSRLISAAPSSSPWAAQTWVG